MIDQNQALADAQGDWTPVIDLSFDISVDEFVTASQLAMRRRPGSGGLPRPAQVLAVMAGAGVAAALVVSGRVPAWIAVPLFIVVTGLFLYSQFWLRPRRWAKDSFGAGPQRWVLSEAGIEMYDAGNPLRDPWSVYDRLAKEAGYMQLWTGDSAFFVPIRAFGSEAEVQRFDEFVRRHLPPG